MRLKAAGNSDLGLKRRINEDSYLLSPDMGLYLVADGMGGHKAGEIASRMVIDTIKDYWIKIKKNEPQSLIEPIEKELPDSAKHLLNSISLANRVIFEAQKNPQYSGMGSTVSALLVDKNRIWSANVGDSRVYLLSHGNLKIISEEHSVEAEQKNMGLINSHSLSNPYIKNLLTRVLGLNEKVDAFITVVEPDPGDTILMCSDGLTNYVSEESIGLIIANSELSIKQKVTALIHAANDGGGGDNITAILLEVLDDGRWGRLKNRLKIQ